jgi:hypothetical protein
MKKFRPGGGVESGLEAGGLFIREIITKGMSFMKPHESFGCTTHWCGLAS